MSGLAHKFAHCGGLLRLTATVLHSVDAFTCWSVASSAKTYNYGSRIDLILMAGPALPGAPRQHPPIDPATHEEKHAPQANRSQDTQRTQPVTHAAMLRAAKAGDSRLFLTGAW